ncbi:caspase family protein [Anaerolineales bacterium HSG6]|nr:caspase family protein [Anaerolineales bacterium HSG6]
MSQKFTHGYAVIIGVGADLPITIDDAQAVANFLHDPARCAYPAEQVQLLTGETARRDHILTALDRLAEQVQADPEATAVVYFSGHGLETPNYYLMPFGYDQADLAKTAISGDEFTTRLRAIQAKKLLVLLDCCHAGGQAEAKTLPGVKSPLPASVITELGQSSGRVIIASSRKDELSFAFKDKHPYSVFTVALLEALAGYGASEQDGYARVLDTAMWVGRKVPELSDDRQHPIVKVSGLEDNFAVAYYAAGDKSPQKLDWTASMPSMTSDVNENQIISWQRRLKSRRRALMLIEERMNDYIEYQKIPLQLIDNKYRTEEDIAKLEQYLGLR